MKTIGTQRADFDLATEQSFVRKSAAETLPSEPLDERSVHIVRASIVNRLRIGFDILNQCRRPS
jgi:hypothetical protein